MESQNNFDGIVTAVSSDLMIQIYFYSSLHSAPRQERSLFVILAWITVTFLIFHTPRAVLNVYEFKSYHDRETCQDFADQFAATTYRAINATDDGGRVAAINETLVSSGPWFREGLPPPDQLSYEGKPITSLLLSDLVNQALFLCNICVGF